MNLKIVVAFVAVTLLAQQANAAPPIESRTMARPEGMRNYLVMRPSSATSELRPLLILLHGHGGSAEFMLGQVPILGYSTLAWRQIAEREGILVIAPNGVDGADGNSAWNDCRADAASNSTADDVGFISALIDRAILEYHADPKRIYVFGHSNGGGMAYRLGIELAPRLAAIGVQSMLMPARSSCKPAAFPMPVFVSHGTQDQVIPYGSEAMGGAVLTGRGTGLSAEESVAVWRHLAALPETPGIYQFPHLNPTDPTSATRFVWGSDPNGLQVCFLRIEGGGHVHASKTEEFPLQLRKLVGEMNHDVDTAEEVWSFFKGKHAPVD
jgi:polyhydroxybutyrate depolymerase